MYILQKLTIMNAYKQQTTTRRTTMKCENNECRTHTLTKEFSDLPPAIMVKYEGQTICPNCHVEKKHAAKIINAEKKWQAKYGAKHAAKKAAKLAAKPN